MSGPERVVVRIDRMLVTDRPDVERWLERCAASLFVALAEGGPAPSRRDVERCLRQAFGGATGEVSR